MRWGLVPRWWSKPLKELRAATFNARAETVEPNRFSAMRSNGIAADFNVGLLRVAEYGGR